MKKFLLLAAISIVLLTCQKETQLRVGQYYHYKSWVFNKGAFQPQEPVLVDSLYTDPSTGLPYAMSSARIDWNAISLKAGNGVKQATVDGTRLSLAETKWGDTTTIKWYKPQIDLEP